MQNGKKKKKNTTTCCWTDRCFDWSDWKSFITIPKRRFTTKSTICADVIKCAYEVDSLPRSKSRGWGSVQNKLPTSTSWSGTRFRIREVSECVVNAAQDSPGCLCWRLTKQPCVEKTQQMKLCWSTALILAENGRRDRIKHHLHLLPSPLPPVTGREWPRAAEGQAPGVSRGHDGVSRNWKTTSTWMCSGSGETSLPDRDTSVHEFSRPSVCPSDPPPLSHHSLDLFIHTEESFVFLSHSQKSPGWQICLRQK